MLTSNKFFTLGDDYIILKYLKENENKGIAEISRDLQSILNTHYTKIKYRIKGYLKKLSEKDIEKILLCGKDSNSYIHFTKNTKSDYSIKKLSKAKPYCNSFVESDEELNMKLKSKKNKSVNKNNNCITISNIVTDINGVIDRSVNNVTDNNGSYNSNSDSSCINTSNSMSKSRITVNNIIKSPKFMLYIKNCIANYLNYHADIPIKDKKYKNKSLKKR